MLSKKEMLPQIEIRKCRKKETYREVKVSTTTTMKRGEQND